MSDAEYGPRLRGDDCLRLVDNVRTSPSLRGALATKQSCPCLVALWIAPLRSHETDFFGGGQSFLKLQNLPELLLFLYGLFLIELLNRGRNIGF